MRMLALELKSKTDRVRELGLELKLRSDKLGLGFISSLTTYKFRLSLVPMVMG